MAGKKKAVQGGKRKQDIVFMNVLFCLLVIFIHIASEIVVQMPKNTWMFRIVFSAHRLSSFVVQGFLLLSAVKLFMKSEINYPKYYLGRFLRVIVPYVIWVFIYYCYFCYKKYFGFSLSDFIGYVLRGDLSAHFYYIIILIQFDLLAPLWRFIYKKGNAAVHVAFALIITVICHQYLMPILATLFPAIPAIDFTNCFLRYLVYWTAGCMIGKHYEEFRAYLKKNIIQISVMFIFCGVLNVALALTTVGHPPVWLEFVHILYCMSAILFMYMAGQLFAGNSLLKPLSLIDKSSYAIYLIHCLILVMTNHYMDDHGITSLTMRFGIRAATVYGISIGLCVLWQIIKIPIANAIRRS